MDVTREFTDILQNIESAIVTVCCEHPDLKDADVLLATERLTGLYTREKKKLPTLPVSLPVKVMPLFEAMKDMCEIRLTRDSVKCSERRNNGLPGAATHYDRLSGAATRLHAFLE